MSSFNDDEALGQALTKDSQKYALLNNVKKMFKKKGCSATECSAVEFARGFDVCIFGFDV